MHSIIFFSIDNKCSFVWLTHGNVTSPINASEKF